ncbi:hypothetical protein ACR3K2_20520 [Cryptosporidium serpentis]
MCKLFFKVLILCVALVYGQNIQDEAILSLPKEPSPRRLSGPTYYNTVYEPVYVQQVEYIPVKSYKKVAYTPPKKSTTTVTQVVPSKTSVRYVPVGYAKGVQERPQMYVPVTKAQPTTYIPVTTSKQFRQLEEIENIKPQLIE